MIEILRQPTARMKEAASIRREGALDEAEDMMFRPDEIKEELAWSDITEDKALLNTVEGGYISPDEAIELQELLNKAELNSSELIKLAQFRHYVPNVEGSNSISMPRIAALPGAAGAFHPDQFRERQLRMMLAEAAETPQLLLAEQRVLAELTKKAIANNPGLQKELSKKLQQRKDGPKPTTAQKRAADEAMLKDQIEGIDQVTQGQLGPAYYLEDGFGNDVTARKGNFALISDAFLTPAGNKFERQNLQPVQQVEGPMASFVKPQDERILVRNVPDRGHVIAHKRVMDSEVLPDQLTNEVSNFREELSNVNKERGKIDKDRQPTAQEEAEIYVNKLTELMKGRYGKEVTGEFTPIIYVDKQGKYVSDRPGVNTDGSPLEAQQMEYMRNPLLRKYARQVMNEMWGG